MTDSKDLDELAQRYQQASAADPQRPSQRVREAVRTHAQMALAARRDSGAHRPDPGALRALAANQPRWKLSALASVAVVGLAGLLVLQFDRGTAPEKELALGQPAPAMAKATGTSTAQAPLPSPVPSPSVREHSVGRAAETAALGTDATAAAMAKSTRPLAEARKAESEQSPATAVVPHATPAEPSAQSALPGPAPPPPPPPPPAMVAAPARLADEPVAPRQAKSATPPAGGLVTQALRQRAPTGAAPDLGVSLQSAARDGRTAPLARLLALGAPLNAPDEAGRTPLMLAVMNGHAEVVQQLLTAGANPALQDQQGLTALQHALRLGHDDIAALVALRP